MYTLRSGQAVVLLPTITQKSHVIHASNQPRGEGRRKRVQTSVLRLLFFNFTETVTLQLCFSTQNICRRSYFNIPQIHFLTGLEMSHIRLVDPENENVHSDDETDETDENTVTARCSRWSMPESSTKAQVRRNEVTNDQSIGSRQLVQTNPAFGS
jgi:hypothetical protein